MDHVDEKPMVNVDAREAPRDVAFWLKLSVLVVLTGLLYYQVLAGLVTDWWSDPNFSHGFLVPFFSAFVVWQDRKRLAALQPKPSWLGLLLVGGSLLVLTVGVLGSEFFLRRTSFVLLLGGLIVYFLGWRYLRALLFPWAFLFFMIPIPAIIFNQIAFPLQFLAAKLASSLLAVCGIPVLREGNVIQLPTLTLEVAEACSGIRSLMSLGALAVIYGYFLETRNASRLLLALSAIPIAVTANALRIMGTGLLGYYWNPDKAEGFFHEFSGWVIFVISLVMLFLVHALLRRIWSGRPKPGAKPA
jgi:exosortase A